VKKANTVCEDDEFDIQCPQNSEWLRINKTMYGRNAGGSLCLSPDEEAMDFFNPWRKTTVCMSPDSFQVVQTK